MRKADLIFGIRPFYLYNLLFWIGLFLVSVFVNLLQENFHWNQQISFPFSFFLLHWVLSYLIVQRYLLSRNLNRYFFIITHLVIGLVYGLFHKGLYEVCGLLLERLFLGQELKTLEEMILAWSKNYMAFIHGLIYYIIFLLLLNLADFHARLKKQQVQLGELNKLLGERELQNLKIQLQPHFLFNAMNTISMMVRSKQNREAVEMLSSLGDMLRISLSNEHRQFVTLKEELDLLRKYLSIEQNRFEESLQVKFNIDPSSLYLWIPSLLLQPIVENAFKHGISKLSGFSGLKISSQKKRDILLLSVYNDSKSIPAYWDLQNSKGIGLRNTISRLRRLYGGNFKFQIITKDKGVIIEMELIAFEENPRNREKN